MTHASGLGYWGRVVGLPVLLVLLTATVLGSHYETNDDFSITLLLRGRTTAAPVTNLHLYFHGWAWLLARLYQTWPGLPWYGLVLYGLLTLALVLLTAVLERLLAPHTSPAQRAGLLAGFLLLAGLEHAQWFNYVRVPLLLGGAAVLWAAQQPGGPRSRPALLLGLLLFAAAWAIRPSAAVLGAVVVAPVAWGLGRPGAWRVVAGAAAVALLLGLLVQLTRTPQAARYRRLDVLKSEVLDYGWRVPAPRTRADSLGVQAVEQWAFGDSTLVNEAFFQRAYRPNPRFVAERLAGLLPAAVQLARDYFPLLALSALLLLLGLDQPAARRRWSQLYLLGLVLLLLGLQLGLKLPPRLAGPLLTLGVLTQLALMAAQPWRLPAWKRRLVLPVLALLVSAYGYKVMHRRQVLHEEERRNLALLRSQLRRPPERARVIVGVGLEAAFKSLSPFRQVVPADGPPWLLLTGWPTLDPSQPQLRQQLTGSRVQPEALRRLARRSDVRWLGPAPLPPARPLPQTYRQPPR
ncbi:hypothetical protein [Hymenobacter jeollabukensis]|uniref:Glycosyltransferase RgtA/B/C/D-like domain-containing protein n=1 Tax=Hymenobacter jeollabukensis TaxID=2025313 RepID=A0A5R8WVZ7_9BACT|nr:hypothetical protein [Hymenobacter jeollabukensis]TLM96700.1 hypothetical protein FDY95_01520 [Hymenobacter jeollabukensis]